MDKFAVLHITKYKDLVGIGLHIDRKHFTPNVNKEKSDFNQELIHTLGSEIDPTKTHLKEELSGKVKELEQDVAVRIAQGYTHKKAIRKDAAKALGVILTGSHERMKEIEADLGLFAAWKEANYNFACQEFGEKNIVRFTLHLDEKTPHFHCVVVPITTDGRLSAGQFVGSPAKLRAYQDRYAHAMAGFGLARGIPKELTQRTHISTSAYYRTINALAQEAQKTVEGVKRSNLLKLDTVRAALSGHITQLKAEVLDKAEKYQVASETSQKLIAIHQKSAFQRRLQEEAQQTYAWIKQAVNLIDFAVDRLDWKLVKGKSTKQDVVLAHAQHGKIIAPTQPKKGTGHWVFSWVDQKGGGTLIDLLLVAGWSWKDIKGLAHSAIRTTVSALAIDETNPRSAAVTIPAPQGQAEAAQERFERLVPSRGKTYLTHRGIARSVYAALPQVHANACQASFCLYKNVDAQGKGELCSTINYFLERDGDSSKYFQKGLPSGLSVLAEAGPIERVVVTESPIDALSYRQLQAEEQEYSQLKTLYVSTCGSLSGGIKEELHHLFERTKEAGQQIVLALDNDLAGRKMTQALSELLSQQACAYQVALPLQGKDWNEFLVAHHGEDKQYRELLSQASCRASHKAVGRNGELVALEGQRPIERVVVTEHLADALLHKKEELEQIKGRQRTFFTCEKDEYAVDEQSCRESYKASEKAQEAVEKQKPRLSHTLYVSTCGYSSEATKEALLEVFSKAKDQDQEIVLYMRKEATSLFKELLQEQACSYSVEPLQAQSASFGAGITQAIQFLTDLSKDYGDDEQEELDKDKTMKKQRGKGISW